MSRTITFQPGEELGGFIEGLVESGLYQNQSEVIRDGLRLLQENYASSSLETLRKLIEEGENSGEPVEWNLNEFLSRMKKNHEGKVPAKAKGGG